MADVSAYGVFPAINGLGPVNEPPPKAKPNIVERRPGANAATLPATD
jgi:hypothetical protein